MENSRQSSLAQLSAWTDVMKRNKVQQDQKRVQEEEEAYEEEFEDYDEDFEIDESPIKAPQKTPVAPTLPEVKSNLIDKLPSSHVSTFGDIGASLARSVTDPRAVRIQRVRKSGVLRLNSEKFTNANIPSVPLYETYLQQLRRNPIGIRQIGVPMDFELRDIDQNTDDIPTTEKSVQFSFGDDTKFFDILSAVRDNKKSGDFHSLRSAQSQHEDNRESTQIGDSSGLSAFLHRSAAMIESIQKDNKGNALDLEQGQQGSTAIFVGDKPWKRLGRTNKSAANELTRLRRISFIKFNRQQPNLLLVIHDYPVDEHCSEDLRPFKGLITIWDTNEIGSPTLILEASGQFTAGSFSNNQGHIVVAGSTDGVVHLWDLREAKTLHFDRDAQDLQIASGIRKPTFSTSMLTPTINRGEEIAIHVDSVLQVESLDSAAVDSRSGSASQFLTLDENGLIIFWITSDRKSTDSSDLRQSPWGRMVLLATRQLSILHGSVHSAIKAELRVQIDPADPTCIFFCGIGGSVSRIGSMGSTLEQRTFHRLTDCATLTSLDQKRRGVMKHHQRVTHMALGPRHDYSGFPRFLVVGYNDNSVDLFNAEDEYPLISWSLFDLQKKNALEVNFNFAVKSLCWLSPFSFLVIDSAGTYFVFDLLESLTEPMAVGKLDLELKLADCVIDHFVDLTGAMKSMLSIAEGSSIHVRPIGSSRTRKYESSDIDSLRKTLARLPTQSRNSIDISIIP